jgi:hypothetical protein
VQCFPSWLASPSHYLCLGRWCCLAQGWMRGLIASIAMRASLRWTFPRPRRQSCRYFCFSLQVFACGFDVVLRLSTMQAVQRAMARRPELFTSAQHARVTHVACDFSAGESFLEKLCQSGFDPREPKVDRANSVVVIVVFFLRSLHPHACLLYCLCVVFLHCADYRVLSRPCSLWRVLPCTWNLRM